MAQHQDMNRNASSKSQALTLDELLQLKRAEAPPPTFWPKFDETLRQRSLRAFVDTSRQQRRHLWRGWGLGTSLAAFLALMIPVGLLFLDGIPGVTGGSQASNPTQEGETAVLFAGHGLVHVDAQEVDTVRQSSMAQWVPTGDFRFVIETLEPMGLPGSTDSSPDASLELRAEQSDRFVSDVITVSDSLNRSGRGSAFF